MGLGRGDIGGKFLRVKKRNVRGNRRVTVVTNDCYSMLISVCVVGRRGRNE